MQHAQSANRAKPQFLASMGHETRAPMNGFLGNAELLLGTELNPRQRRFAQTIGRSAQSLAAIINDVRDVSEIESAKLKLDSIVVDVRELAEDEVELSAMHAHCEGPERNCIVPATLPSGFRGDPLRLRRGPVNPVGNGANVRADGLSAICAVLEDRARDNVLERADRLIEEVGSAYPSVATALEAYSKEKAA